MPHTSARFLHLACGRSAEKGRGIPWERPSQWNLYITDTLWVSHFLIIRRCPLFRGKIHQCISIGQKHVSFYREVSFIQSVLYRKFHCKLYLYSVTLLFKVVYLAKVSKLKCECCGTYFSGQLKN